MQRSTGDGPADDTGLTLNDDVSDEIINLYVSLAPGYLTDLVTARKGGDLKSLKFHAHKLASVMGVMGFNDMNRLLIRMEHEEMDEDELDLSISKISATIDESLNLIDRLRR